MSRRPYVRRHAVSSVRSLINASKRTPAPPWLQCAVQAFVVVKHTICALYFAAQAYIFLTLSPISLDAVHVYMPTVTAYTYIVLASCHVVLLVTLYVWLRKRQRRSMMTPVAPDVATPGPTASLVVGQPRHMRSPTEFVDAIIQWCLQRLGVSHDTANVAFNAFELACQSYQLMQILGTVIDAWFVQAYAIIVVVHSLLTPWLFVSTRHRAGGRLHTVLVGWSRSVVSFCLSCLLPVLSLIAPALEYLWVDPTLSRDTFWTTRVLLVAQIVVVTSGFDYVTK
ncbi:hypothetical protein As57867_005327, partial [Aphanomyces stellatus]